MTPDLKHSDRIRYKKYLPHEAIFVPEVSILQTPCSPQDERDKRK